MRALRIFGLALIALALTPAIAAARCWKGETVSWYVDRHTASGESYRHDESTCAHRTAKFGTKFKVTDRRTGKSTVCRVNDRGPNKWTKCELDLNKVAAREIGITHRGVAKAKIEVVNPHLLVASSGAKASVSTIARPHFQCLLSKLEAVGYRVDEMGGYASRGNSSAHPTGNALDINQISRNHVSRPLPVNATEMARDCGLVHGAVWDNPDQGHFEMPRKYGYIFKHRRIRYAART